MPEPSHDKGICYPESVARYEPELWNLRNEALQPRFPSFRDVINGITRPPPDVGQLNELANRHVFFGPFWEEFMRVYQDQRNGMVEIRLEYASAVFLNRVKQAPFLAFDQRMAEGKELLAWGMREAPGDGLDSCRSMIHPDMWLYRLRRGVGTDVRFGRKAPWTTWRNVLIYPADECRRDHGDESSGARGLVNAPADERGPRAKGDVQSQSEKAKLRSKVREFLENSARSNNTQRFIFQDWRELARKQFPDCKITDNLFETAWRAADLPAELREPGRRS